MADRHLYRCPSCGLVTRAHPTSAGRGRADCADRLQVGVQRQEPILARVPPRAGEVAVSGWTYGPEEAYAVQVLARHQMVERVLADVAQDMQICRIEGWDVWEYPRMLRDAIPAPPKGGGVMDDWLMPGIPRNIAECPDMETVRRIRASVTSDTGQVVESDLLEPCPFCGGRPYIQTYELGDTCVDARVVCPSCHVSTARECQSWRVWHGDDELTRTLAIGRAISGWNRRVLPWRS